MEPLCSQRRLSWCAFALLALPAAAQTIQAPAPVVPKAQAWRKRSLTFSDPKPLLGLPDVSMFLGMKGKTACATDGTAFFNNFADSDSVDVLQLLSVPPDGAVKTLLRKRPPLEFDTVAVQDFFAADHTLVSLLKAEKRDERGGGNPPRETVYFLSLMDHDGDAGSILSLNLHFRPLKIAMFGQGDFMVLGWDELNLMPELAVLKDDGTIRRFIDLDNRRSDGGLTLYGLLKGEEARPSAKTLKLLEHAFFVPFGDEVLLAQRDSVAPVLVMGPVGEDRRIPMELPDGFLLQDILVSGPRVTMVVRAQEKPPETRLEGREPSPPLRQRLFEVDSNHGALHGGVLSEFLLPKPEYTDITIGSITCAPPHKLLAIYPLAIGDAPPNASGETPTQLVFGSAPR